ELLDGSPRPTGSSSSLQSALALLAAIAQDGPAPITAVADDSITYPSSAPLAKSNHPNSPPFSHNGDKQRHYGKDKPNQGGHKRVHPPRETKELNRVKHGQSPPNPRGGTP